MATKSIQKAHAMLLAAMTCTLAKGKAFMKEEEGVEGVVVAVILVVVGVVAALALQSFIVKEDTGLLAKIFKYVETQLKL